MADGNVTAAAVVSFVEALEDTSATFYEKLAAEWTEQSDQFLTFAHDCARSKKQVVRTYQETISDALDATFSFEGLDLEAFRPNTSLPADIGFADSVRTAIDLEEKAVAFYETATKQASLLATIPRAFARVARRREKRKVRLNSLLGDDARP